MATKKEIEQVDNEAASRLQLAVFKAILKQIEDNPLEVPASTLAVAEKLLARYNVGLGFNLVEDRAPTKEEQDALAEWERLQMESDLFIEDE